jgi:hypothetical protein
MLTYKLTGTTEASGSTAANNNSVHPPPARSPAVIRPNLHAPRCANGAAMLTCGNAVLAEVRDVRLSSFKTVERQTPSASATCGLHFDGGATTTRRQQSARRGRKPFEVERPKAPLVTVLPDVQLECPPDPHPLDEADNRFGRNPTTAIARAVKGNASVCRQIPQVLRRSATQDASGVAQRSGSRTSSDADGPTA